MFTACNSNDGTNALPDNNKTEISDTLDENGNRGECIRNSYTVYDDSTKMYQQYGKCITYCDVDEYIYTTTDSENICYAINSAIITIHASTDLFFMKENFPIFPNFWNSVSTTKKAMGKMIQNIFGTNLWQEQDS